ncbi:MAG: hypothetical protein R2745_00660 [Vicinamibacterales bacterium]
MRVVSLLLALAVGLTPGLVAAGLAEPPEPCPMAGTPSSDLPCLTAPCPCDHGTPVAPLPLTAAATVPAATPFACPTSAPAPATMGSALPSVGFPFPIDRPPGARAS